MQTVSRLIDQFIPEHYQLSVNLNRVERKFSGVITMNGSSTSNANKIAVHAKDLKIKSVTVDGKDAEFASGENDELSIAEGKTTAGRHIVVIGFEGEITDAMHGLYPCYYEHKGEKKELLATQFESHHAREAFPCIDEPEAKATFDVTLTTEKDITVLGNMPIKKQKEDGDTLVTTFDTTPRMSTYLLAWVTGELQRKTAVTKQGVEVNVWATPAQPADSLDFALDIATRTIDFFNEYFDTPYPLPKSDHVALPDFSSGAMENWGLITYRESTLLAEPGDTSIDSKHYIATVITHELSHQWFGNLVTMKWWNDLWLNESFASIMEYIAVDALHPEWNIWLDYSMSDCISALRRDSLEGVQSVQLDVNHPDEISTLFDPSIVYAKGARLLRMLQQYIGHSAFQAGLKAYFARHKYGNTEGNDLWEALSEASGKDIAKFMNAWISQSGYPVVKVQQKDDKLEISQKQFFVGPHQPSTRLWPIPLNSSDATLPELLDTKKVAVPYTAGSPLRLNLGDTAHFLTNYDDDLLSKLITEVKAGKSSPLDRLQLIHEQTMLARGGVISSAALIPLVDAYKNETNEAVWDMIALATSELKKFVEDDKSAEKKLRKFNADIARAQYNRLGWTPKNNESEDDTKLRSTIISLMIYGEDKDAISTAKNIYAETKLEDIDPELRSLIIATAVRHGDDPAIIDTLLERYKTATSPDLKQDISAGLTATKNTEVIAKLLSLITDSKTIRHQDVMHWFVWLLRNRDGRSLSWQWLQDNWKWIEKTFGSDKSYDYYPRYAAGALSTRKQFAQYKAFFTPMLKEPALTRVITIGIGEIEGRIELIERDKAAVHEALAKL
jgi:aminopeptidase N